MFERNLVLGSYDKENPIVGLSGLDKPSIGFCESGIPSSIDATIRTPGKLKCSKIGWYSVPKAKCEVL